MEKTKNAKTMPKPKKATDADGYDKASEKKKQVGPNEFEETRSDQLRMKPQPLRRSGK